MSDDEAGASAIYDQSRLLWGKVEQGDADAKAEVDAIAIRMKEAYQLCEDAFGSDAEMRMAEMEENPWTLFNNPELTEDQQDAVLYYINAKAAMDGVRDASNDAMENKRREVAANVERRTHKDTGVLQTATMKVDDRQVYIVKGNIVPLPDGTGIDVRNSDQSIVVCDAETGEYEFASPDQIFTLSEAIDPQSELDEAYANIQAEYDAVLGGNGYGPTENSNPMPQYGVNDTFTLRDAEGNAVSGEVQGISEDGVEIRTDVPINGKYVQVIPAEEFEGMVESLHDADGNTVWDRNPVAESGESVPTSEESVQETETEGTNPTEMFLHGQLGAKEYLLQVGYFPEWVDKQTDETLLEEAAYFAKMNPNAKVHYAEGSPTTEEEPKQEVAPAVQPMAGEEEANRKPTALSRVPLDEKTGEPMFEKADKETALDALNEVTGGNEANTTAIVNAQVEQAQKALDALKKKQPTKKAPTLKGSPMAMLKAQQEADANYNAAMEQYNGQVAQAEETLGAWSRIYALMNERKRAIREQQEAEQRERDQKLHDEAVAQLEEQKRIAAEKAAEQAEVGTHAVNPKIKEKWDVDDNGHRFITASNGSTTFGQITQDSGLTPAPIKLSEGFNIVDEEGNNHGYGLLHIEAGHGAQILEAGYASVKDFVEDVTRNYQEIRIARSRKGNETYILLELHDEKHKRTLYVELSKDGSYWNVNSGGIFKNKYTDKNDIVWPEPTVGSNANTDTAEVVDSPTEVAKGETVDRGGNSSQPISSVDKVINNQSDLQENSEKSPANEGETSLSEKIAEASAGVKKDVGTIGSRGDVGRVGEEQETGTAPAQTEADEDGKSLAKRKATAYERARKRAERQREARRRKKAEAEKGYDMEPHTPTELAASLLGGGGIKLQRASFLKHTGYGNAEAKKYLGILASREKGGMTMEEAGEQVLLADEENQRNLLDHGDANAGLDALLDALHECRTKGELQKYILTNRIREREGEEEAERAREEAERDDYYYWQYHMSYDDYMIYEEELLPLYIEEENRVPEEVRVANLEESVKIREYYENNGRETGGRGAVREKGSGEQGRDEGGGQGGSDSLDGEMPSSRGSVLEGPSRGEAQGYDEGLSEAADGGKPSVREQKATGAVPVSHNERVLREAVDERLREGGLDVFGNTEEGQRVLDVANGGDARLEAKHRSASAEKRNRVLSTDDEAVSMVTGKPVKEVRAERRAREAEYKVETKELYDAVLSGDFNAVTLQRINDYLDHVTPNNEYGRPLSKRLPPEVLRRVRKGERASEVDVLFSRICESAVPAHERTRAEAKRRIEEKKKELLKGWAIATGNWHTSVADFTHNTEPIGRGKDSVVYQSDDGKSVIKVSAGKDNLKKFRPDIDAVTLFNHIFRYNPYEILGYGEVDGKFVKFLKQPFVDFTGSTPLSADERVGYMERMGFKPMNDEKTAFSNGKFVVADLQGNNIVKDHAGNVRVIDADVKLHTRDMGGKWVYPDVETDFAVPDVTEAKITDNVRFFRTANGEAYGFTVGGKIYYDPRIATSETLVHEYAHLWASALRAGNPKEWANVVGLMKGTSVWEDVKKRYPELKTDDEIADEVLAHYSGKRGAERLREEQRKIAHGEGSVFDKAKAISALERVRQAINNFWHQVADFLHIHYTSAEQVADQAMKDLLEGVDPTKFATDNKVREQFIGEKGAMNLDTADDATRMDNKSVAEEMEKAGKDAKAIKLATGWERGADGKWRYEIPDLKFNSEILNEYKEDGSIIELLYLVRDRNLFVAYPELAETTVLFCYPEDGSAGSYNPMFDRIELSLEDATSDEELRSTLVHEVQHAIQRIEGFGTGSSLSSAKRLAREADMFRNEQRDIYTNLVSEYGKSQKRMDLADIKDMRDTIRKEYGVDLLTARFIVDINRLTKVPDSAKQDAINALVRNQRRTPEEFVQAATNMSMVASSEVDDILYLTAMGEVESRNVSARMNLSEEERRNSLAMETEDIDRKYQIPLNVKDDKAHMGSRTNKRMAEIGAHYEGKTLTDEEQAVVDVFSGKRDRQTVTFTGNDGNEHKMLFVQGNEIKAGTKHAVYRHYNTNEGMFDADEIKKVHETLSSGERSEKGGKIEYVYADKNNGVEYTVAAEKKGGKERFVSFYTNRKAPNSGMQNTQLSAQASLSDASDVAKVVKDFTNPNISVENISNEGIKFRLLEDDDPKARELEALPESELVPVYRNVQAFEDDALGSPMAFTDAETGERRTLQGGKWNASAQEDIELTPDQQRQLDELNKNGYIVVDGKKTNELKINNSLFFKKGKTGDAQLQYWLKKNPEDSGVPAAYDPYDHAIETPLNTQFGTAYKRPNLVVVRSLIPKTEIDEPYHAKYALLPTGAHDWNNGRTLYLSRWSKIDKVLTREEEAKLIDEYWKNNPGKREALKSHRDYNRFVPQVRRELEKMGYRFELDGRELTPEESLALDEQNWENRDVIPGREGHIPFISNDDIARINAKMSGKWVGEPKEAMENAMTARVNELAESLNTPVRIVRTDAEVAALPSARQRRMKGSFNPLTGEVTIVVPNNANLADVENTFVHEVVGHDGLRVLFPEKEKLDNALDELYRVSNTGIQQTIDRMAQKMYDAEVDRLREKKRKEHEAKGEDTGASYYADMAEAHVEASKKREQFRRDATEEYGADLAGRIGESGFEKMSAEEQTFWGKLKAMLQKALQKLLDGLKIPGKKKWSDKEWAFVLHEAYKRKKNGGRPTVFDAADTEVMRRKTGVGETKFSDGEREQQTANERFNSELTRYQNGEMDKNEMLHLGRPQGVMRAFLPNLPIVMRQRVIKKGSEKKHEVDVSAIMNMPQHLSSPIFVFQRSEDTIGVLTDMRDRNGKNVCVAIELKRQIQQGAEYLEVNDVRSFHGREFKNIVEPIANIKTLKWVDKEKGLAYLSSASQPVQQEIDKQVLDTATKVVKDFVNPNILNENVADEDIMFRDGDSEEYNKAMARDTYERRVIRGMYQTQEALQDSMLGLKEAMDAILKAEGNGKTYIEEVAGYENAYLGENRLSSTNQAECAEFARRLFKPMLEEVAGLAKTADERAELTDYMMAKHGLERNEVMARRAAEKKANEEFGADIRKAERAVNKDPLDQDAADQLDELRQKRDDCEQDLYMENRTRDYSGLTALTGKDNVADAEAEARGMVMDYELWHTTSFLWDRVNAVTKATLQKTYESGLINKATYEDIKGMYTHYIPLRGFDDKTSDEAYAYLADKHSAFNAPMKTAKGRKSKADDPFANMEAMAESAIMQGNRNTLVKQKFLNFALNHPSDLVSVSDLWLRYDDVKDEWMPVNSGDIAGTEKLEEDDSAAEVERKMRDFEDAMEQAAKSDPAHFKKQKDAPDIPYRVVESRDLRQHQVLVKRNGKDYLLTINGNPRAAQALNGQTNPDNDVSGAIGAIMHLGESVNRQLSAFYTTRNPDFVVSNFMRDMLYSNSMVWVKESPNYAWRYNWNVAKVNPAKMKILLAKLRNGTLDMNDETEKMFKLFIDNGGETGYANIRDIDQRKNDIKREVKKMNGKLPIHQAWDLLSERLDDYSRAVELCARFAAFKTSREMGRTIDRSIYDAKEISVNFNKKGSGAKFMGAEGQTKAGNAAAMVSGLGRSFYVFWNAGIQGTTNFGRQAKRHPKKAIAGVAAMFMLGALMAYLGGDDGDDDGNKDAYYNLPEYVRRSNVVFRLPGMDKSWIALPLPVEYRAMYGMGELAVSVMSGKEHYTGGELAHAMASQVSQMMPLDLLEGSGGFKPFVPSAVKPFAEVLTNESWTGMPIYKDTPYNKDDPEWTKAYKSANPYLVGMSKWLNERTGGDRYTKGKVDINPAKVEYLLNGYFGGLSRSVDELVKMGETATGGMEYDPKNMMFMNRVIKRGDERTEYRAVNEEYWKIREESEALRLLFQ